MCPGNTASMAGLITCDQTVRIKRAQAASACICLPPVWCCRNDRTAEYCRNKEFRTVGKSIRFGMYRFGRNVGVLSNVIHDNFRKSTNLIWREKGCLTKYGQLGPGGHLRWSSSRAFDRFYTRHDDFSERHIGPSELERQTMLEFMGLKVSKEFQFVVIPPLYFDFVSVYYEGRATSLRLRDTQLIWKLSIPNPFYS